MLRGITQQNLAWSPYQLFLNGEQGAWYDPSDLSTLFQDDAGTIPVAAAGDPVGLNRGKSGNALHISQSIAASRPVYSLVSGVSSESFDGTDDYLGTSSVNFTASEFSLFVACMTNTPAALSGIFKSGDAALSTGESYVLIRAGGSSGVSDGTQTVFDNFAFSAGIATIVEIHYSPTTVEFIQDGAVVATVTGSFGAVAFTNDILIGSSRSDIQRWNGNHYGSVFIDENVSEPDRQSTRQYLAQKAGITL